MDRNLWGVPIPPPPPAPPPRPEAEPGPAWASWKEEGEHFRRTGRGAYSVPPATPEESLFRHSCWLPRRVLVAEALQRVAAPQNRQERFAECGSSCTVERSPSTGEIRCRSNHCRDRFCLVCGQGRSRLIAANLERHLGGREARFVTLTIKHTTATLHDQLKRLIRSFRNLRQGKFWKDHVCGGAAFIEVKRSASGKHWHPHLHILCEGGFIPQHLLSAAWLLVTGDSSVVDVRYVREASAVVRYVAKYAAKPLDSSLFDREAFLDEAVLALRGKRLCTTFGTWRGVELEACPEDPADWVPICSLTRLIRARADGEAWAVALLALIRREGHADAQRPLQGNSS